MRTLVGRRVFVTGCSGFIGRHLVTELVDAGAQITICCRSRRSAAELERKYTVSAVIGELSDATSLRPLLRDQEIVFHLAYDGRATASANLAAFDGLYSAATQANVERFVHTSSIVVYDDWPTSDITEQSAMNRPGGGPYRQAKIEMEHRLMGGPIPAAILQPTIVYGPGSALWTDQFLEHLAVGAVVLPDPHGHCNGVFVHDVVQALLRAAVVSNLQRERFIISGPANFSWAALLEGYARLIGSGSIEYEPLEQLQERLGPPHEESGSSDTLTPLIRVYALGQRLIGRERFEQMLRFVKRRVARDGRMYPDHHLLGVYCSSANCDISLARERLAYQPVYDLAKGLAAMASNP